MVQRTWTEYTFVSAGQTHSGRTQHWIKQPDQDAWDRSTGQNIKLHGPLAEEAKEIKLQPDSTNREERFKLSNAWNHRSSLLRHSNILSHVRVVTIRGVLDWMSGFIDTLYTPLGTAGSYRAIADLHILQFTITHALGFSVFTSHILATDL
jgi:hypothetical protein